MSALGFLVGLALCLCFSTVKCSNDTSSSPILDDDDPSIRVYNKSEFMIELVDKASRDLDIRSEILNKAFREDALESLFPQLLDEMDARSAQLRTVLADPKLSYFQKRIIACIYANFAEKLGLLMLRFAVHHGFVIGNVPEGGGFDESEIERMWHNGFPGLENENSHISSYAKYVDMMGAMLHSRSEDDG